MRSGRLVKGPYLELRSFPVGNPEGEVNGGEAGKENYFNKIKKRPTFKSGRFFYYK